MRVNALIRAYLKGLPLVITDSIGFDSYNAVVTFMHVLHERTGNHGPFLIVTDASFVSQWIEAFRGNPTLFAVHYSGSETALSRLEQLYFDATIETVRFHVLIVPSTRLQRHCGTLKVHKYTVAFFHGPDSRRRLIGAPVPIVRSFAIVPTDTRTSVREAGVLANFFARSRVRSHIPSSARTAASAAASRIREALSGRTPGRVVVGDSAIVTSVNCPPSAVQHRACAFALSYARESISVASAKVHRILSHPFAIEGGEWTFGGDFIEVSTKLLVLDEVLRDRDAGSVILVVSQYTDVLDAVSDLAELRGLATYACADADGPSDEASVILWNARSPGRDAGLDRVGTVVVIDGASSAWERHSASRRVPRGVRVLRLK
jgi:hypothetical protein